MKTIYNIKDLVDLDINLAKFILGTYPSITEGWDHKSTGYIFLLDYNDSLKVTQFYTFPTETTENQ